MLLDEVVEMVADDLFHQTLELTVGSARYLQEQAFLERAGPDARRVEGLQDLQDLLYLLHRHVDAVVDGELITDIIETLAQQAVTVEGADEILHDLLLLIGELRLAHLLFELVVERGGVAPHRFFIVGIRVGL